MISVNQINTQIKITEAWKANNVSKIPLKFKKVTRDSDYSTTIAITNGKLLEFGRVNVLK